MHNSYSKRKNEKYRKTHQKIKEKIQSLNAIKELNKRGMISKALSEIELFLQKYPDDDYGIYLYGSILTRLKQFDLAKKQFLFLVNCKSKNMYSALYELAGISKEEGDIDCAQAYLKRAIAESPYEENSCKIKLAQIEELNGNYNEAIRILNTVSGYEQAYSKLEHAKIMAHVFEKPQEALDIIITISNVPSEILSRKISLERGRIESALNNYESAIFFFNEALDGPKNDIYYSALLEKAKLEVQFNNIQEAEKLCKILLNKHIDFKGDVQWVLGRIATAKKDYLTAKKNYLEVITKATGNDKKKERAYISLGISELQYHNYDLAMESFSKISDNSPYKKDALLGMICTEIRRENYEDAANYLNEMESKKLVELDDKEFRRAKIFINQKLQKISTSIKPNTYCEKQILNYKESRAIQHIEEEHTNNSDSNKSSFRDDISIKNLITEIKTKLDPTKSQANNTLDTYFVDYPNIGYTQTNIPSNLIKVMTIANTKNIITMYPVESTTEEYEVHKSQPVMQKRMSQIEKFNAKYKK